MRWQVERVWTFLPSILIIGAIAGATRFYLKWVLKRFGDNFNSVEWQKRNQWKVVWAISTPTLNVWAPAVEELMFRAPIIIAFGAMSSIAWYVVLTSSALFALVHWFGPKVQLPEIISEQEGGRGTSDNVVEEMNRLSVQLERNLRMRKLIHVIATFPLGILAGYYGIKYQSIWVAFGIHSLWNLIMPGLLPFVALTVMLIYYGISSLWYQMRWRRRKSGTSQRSGISRINT